MSDHTLDLALQATGLLVAAVFLALLAFAVLAVPPDYSGQAPAYYPPEIATHDNAR